MAHPDIPHPQETIFAPGEFPVDDDVIYLNHAAVGAMPRRAGLAIAAFCEEAMRRPTVNYGRWLKAEASLRGRIARLLGGRDPANVSLTANTSHAISIVAGGFPWQDGDNVVLPRGEFPSNCLPWRALAARNVEVREVELGPGVDPSPLLAACDARTRLVAASWIRYDDGARLDLETLASACSDRGIRLLVDVIQGAGAVRVPEVPVDYLVGGAHKWMLGPEGVGYLCATPAARAILAPSQFGWRMLENAFAFDAPGRVPVADGRRFEPGTMNMLGIVGLEASLAVIEDAGIERVQQAVEARAGYLLEALRSDGRLAIATPARAAHRAGIVALSAPGNAELPEQLFRALQRRGVVTAVRGGLLRFSPHAHTPFDALDDALERLDGALTS